MQEELDRISAESVSKVRNEAFLRMGSKYSDLYSSTCQMEPMHFIL
jgi:hypothetical protein